MSFLKGVLNFESWLLHEETHLAFAARDLVGDWKVEIDMSTPVLVGCPKYDVTPGHANTAHRAGNDLV